MIHEQASFLEMRKAFRLEVLEATGLPGSSVVFGVRGSDAAKPNISIFEIENVAIGDTMDGDSSLKEETFQVTVHARRSSQCSEIAHALEQRFSNKAPGPFQRTTFRIVAGYAEPEDNSHNVICEVTLIYNLV